MNDLLNFNPVVKEKQQFAIGQKVWVRTNKDIMQFTEGIISAFDDEWFHNKYTTDGIYTVKYPLNTMVVGADTIYIEKKYTADEIFETIYLLLEASYT